MAKQRGIHQIKGKINNLCYYEQKYIRGGLIRRINEAMSERLKIDPAFENTRHYNTIFGACSNFAKSFLSVFGSRNKFLFLPYRQAILTKYLFDNRLYSGVTSGFPGIGFNRSSPEFWVSLIDNLMKNKLSKNFPSIPRVILGLDVNSTITVSIPSSELEDFCARYNVKSLLLSHTPPLYFYLLDYLTDLQKYSTPDYNTPSRLVNYIWSVGDGDLDIVLSSDDIDDTFTYWILYISPIIYQIGGRNVTKNTGASSGIIYFSAS